MHLGGPNLQKGMGVQFDGAVSSSWTPCRCPSSQRLLKRTHGLLLRSPTRLKELVVPWKLLAPIAGANISGSYSWEIHSPSASRVVPPPISQNLNQSVFIKALRITFRRRIPFAKPKVGISVFDEVKPDNTGRDFLGGLSGFQTNQQSVVGGDLSGTRISGNAGRDSDLSLSTADQRPTNEYVVSIESSTDSTLVRKPIDE